jgi:hypothetical protein
MTEEKKKTALGTILDAVSLKWIRPLIHNLGGRKLVVGGGGLAVITQVIATEMGDWQKVIICVAVALISVGTGFNIAHEDKGKEKPQ